MSEQADKTQAILDAVTGAIVRGNQGGSPPPSRDHWLYPFWEMGNAEREEQEALAQRCRELEQRLLSQTCQSVASGWRDAKQRRELDDCLSRGIAATEGERDTLRAEVERYKAQVIEEAGKVLSLADELAKLRRWEKEVRENSPLLIRLDSAEAERDALRGLLAECAEYLNTNNLTSIGHGSILHRKMIGAAMEVPR